MSRGNLSLMLVLVVLCACATTSQFTTESELMKIRSAPRPEKVLRGAGAEVDEWQLEGPFPDSLGRTTHSGATPWARLLSTSKAQPSGALECAAREFARFIVAQKGAPGVLLRDHVLARCGWSARASLQWLDGDVHGDDDAVFAAWRTQLEPMVAQTQRGEVGLAFVRQNGRAAAVLVTGQMAGNVEVAALRPVNGHVVLTGLAPPQAVVVEAYINQGSTKAVRCAQTGQAVLPRFSVDCPVDEHDVSSWVSLTSRDKGRFLGFEFAHVLVWPGTERPLTWKRPVHVTGHRPATPEAIVEALNAVRGELALKSVKLSAGQVDENRELAPFFFDAIVRGESREQDHIGLGVIAGWHVEHEVSRGTFTAAIVERVDGAELLNQLLEGPWARAELLDPQTVTVAPGVLVEGAALGVLVSSYTQAATPHYRNTMNEALNHLNQLREKRGLKKVQWVLLPTGEEERLAKSLESRQLASDEALGALLQSTVDATRKPARGWAVSANAPDEVEWPDELLQWPTAQVVCFVASVKDPGVPWVRPFYFLAVLGAGSNEL